MKKMKNSGFEDIKMNDNGRWTPSWYLLLEYGNLKDENILEILEELNLIEKEIVKVFEGEDYDSIDCLE